MKMDIITWANANQGFIMTLLTFVYVIATIRLVRLAQRQAQTAVELERSRTRPVILFDLVIKRNFVFAAVKNCGLSPAKDVHIIVTPNIEYIGSSSNPDSSVHSYGVKSKEIPFIVKGVAMMPPQGEISALVGFFGFVRDAHPELRFEGKVSYCSTDGISYSEPFIVDLSARDGALSIATKDIHDVAQQLESIAKSLDRISSELREPLIRTMTEEQYQAKEQALIDSLNKVQSDESTSKGNEKPE